MLFPFIKRWLEKRNWYIPFRYHPATISLWLILRRSVAADLSQQKKFYQSLLKETKGNLIFDLGANEGFLTQIFVGMGFKVIAIEPSLHNVKVLRTRFRRNLYVTIIPFAISDTKGREIFFESESDRAINTLSAKWKKIGEKKVRSNKLYKSSFQVETVTLDQIIQKFGVPAFIKIDVEGYEENALKGLNQQVPLLSFEAILPDFTNESIRCVERFYMLSDAARFNYVVDNKLAYKSFVSKEELILSIQSLPPQTIEIICKVDQ